jgi:hypothetical protein
MLQKLQNLYAAFDGHKTVIGLALLQLSPYLPPPYNTYCTAAGAILAGVGVTARAVDIGNKLIVGNPDATK